MERNIYDDETFFSSYSSMTRSRLGLTGAGEWASLESLIPDVAGLRILDLGCGFGWHAAYFAKHGALDIDAVDISERMLGKARRINSDEKIRYTLCDIEAFSAGDESYDLVFSSLAMHYVRNYRLLVSRIYKWLRKNGTFLFSFEHPAFTAEGSEDWFYDEEGGILHFPLDNYFSEGIRETHFLGSIIPKYHRTLTTYVSALLEAGFTLTGLVEPEVPEHLKTLDEMKNEWRRPMMLIIRAEKR